ncbi:uracil-DNA glycosylase-like protein [Elsinoe ampelina]|uniref:Uracil-DNA glycosylase n=1 Tax=Elsinoe ampelina TaxID=302913 RepID=A0A6A6G2F7_9PEZI|nr:uracil-DNA glycosylase-like protein [Elsinoe ampelina]
MASPTLKRKAGDLAPSDAKKPKANGSITSFFGQPKPTSTPSKPTTEPAPIKFDKQAWIDKLTEEQRTLLDLEITTLDDSWLAVLHTELTTPSFLSLKRFLQSEAKSGTKIFPPQADIYSWSRHTPLHSVKAVILGQDPYHNLNQAHGLCFSVRPPTKAPPSLKNIYVALKKDYPSFRPPPDGLGLLTPWADRGVLLLNTCLTVTAHLANSHAGKGWEKFTQKVIDVVAQKRTKGVVFLAWGSPAQKRCAGVDGTRHLVLKSVHPSPLSAHKGFLDCGHFRKANEWLVERYGAEEGIDWNLEMEPEEAGV